ncbi:trypsin-like serine protease [Candidatus Pacearchaeota archaeon]|nr:trypsin-like serine protease [Candidatus Pacearchaeota archaeon]
MVKTHKLLVSLIVLLVVIQIISVFYFINENTTIKEDFLAKEKSLKERILKLDDKLFDLDQKIELNSMTIKGSIKDIDELNEDISDTQQSISDTQMDLEEKIDSIEIESSSDFSEIIDDTIESIVSIKTNIAQGTGFLISDDGYLVTNAHVIERSRYINAITYERDSISALLIGIDLDLDIAVLKIPGNYDKLNFDDSDNVKVGEKVIAIGNPEGLSFSVTEGIVSAVDRKKSSSSGRYIQTDAALNSGNSGGPLINTNGRVIGINNFKLKGDNIGFSLESNFIIDSVNEISMEELGFEVI